MIDFVCIGAQKAGTTWLWNSLKQHPAVHFSPTKEVHYFDTLYLDTDRRHRLRVLGRAVERIVGELEAAGAGAEQLDRVRRLTDKSFAFTDAWYEALFERRPQGALTGDITPIYSALPDEGIAHLRRLSPAVRLVYLVRDPVSRGMSSLRHMGQRTSIEALLASRAYRSRGDYRANIERWEAHFPASQILYIPFGDIKTDPLGVIRAAEQHIGLSPLAHYGSLDVASGSTSDAEIVLPEGIEARVAEVFAGQLDYLTERFGAGFVSRIA